MRNAVEFIALPQIFGMIILIFLIVNATNNWSEAKMVAKEMTGAVVVVDCCDMLQAAIQSVCNTLSESSYWLKYAFGLFIFYFPSIVFRILYREKLEVSYHHSNGH
jgi:hypothetical protein